MIEKTNKDLYLSAHAAAVKLLGVTNPLTVSRAQIAEFEADQFEGGDFAKWCQFFTEATRKLTDLAKQDSPMTISAKSAALNAKKVAERQAAIDARKAPGRIVTPPPAPAGKPFVPPAPAAPQEPKKAPVNEPTETAESKE